MRKNIEFLEKGWVSYRMGKDRGELRGSWAKSSSMKYIS